MSEVLSIRIPRELKKALEELKDIDWKGEIVEFLRERVEYYRRLKVLKKARGIIEKLPEVAIGTASSYVREDRDINRCIVSSKMQNLEEYIEM